MLSSSESSAACQAGCSGCEKGLFNDSQNITLTDDGQFFAVDFDLGAGILAGDDMIAHLDGHFHFLAVHDTAGANGQDFCYIGLFLGAAGEDDAALGGFSASTILMITRSARGFSFIVDCLLIVNHFIINNLSESSTQKAGVPGTTIIIMQVWEISK